MEEDKLLPEGNAEKDSKPNIIADNLQQEETLSSTETVLPEAESIAIEQQPTTNLSAEALAKEDNQPQTENMEVHHHAHNPAEPHHKKNWKGYFWEFLMLFLAVFCGFLAEYQLEHKIEKDRSKQYIYSFYEDLKTDSSHFNKLIIGFEKKLSVLQSMSPCYDSLLSDKLSKNCLSTIAQNSNVFPDMIYTDRTLMQLKNAGGLRLLKKADADSILLYDNLLRQYKTYETTGFQEIQYDLRETFSLLRNYETWKDTTHSPRVFAMYGNNKELLNKYFNQLSIYSNFSQARMNDLEKLKKRNAELIQYFKAKYHYE
jgi:hypothetical protein